MYNIEEDDSISEKLFGISNLQVIEYHSRYGCNIADISVQARRILRKD